MTGIVNLRQARKRRAREADRSAADANAARHGIATSERARARAQVAQARRTLDGHLRTQAPEPDCDSTGG